MKFKNKILASAMVLASAYGSMAMGAAVNGVADSGAGTATVGDYKNGDTLQITVSFDAGVNLVTTGAATLDVALDTGGTLQAALVTTDATNITDLVFELVLTTGVDPDGITIPSPATAITLNGDTVLDNSDNTTLSGLDLTAFAGPIAGTIIDAVLPVLTEDTAVTPNPTGDSTPDYSFTTTESVDLTFDASCGSSSPITGVTGSPTIQLTQNDNTTPLTTGTYAACTITGTDAAGNASTPLAVTSFDVDVTAPTLSVPVVVPTPGTDATPDFGFTSDEAGTISIANCTPAVAEVAPATAIVGANTITLSGAAGVDLAGGTYTGCEITVTDALTNASTPFAVADFEITAPPAPAPTATTAVPLNYPWVMLLTLAGLGFVVRKRFPKAK